MLPARIFASDALWLKTRPQFNMPPEHQALATAAKALRESAKAHKRASASHRKSSRACMEALSKLQEACRELGIKLDVVGEEEIDHGRSTNRSTGVEHS